MTDRQRRRLVATIIWGGIVLIWAGFLLARSVYNIPSQARWEAFVVLTVGTAAVLIGRVCIRAIHREHAYTRNVIAGLPDWITVLMAQKVHEAISTSGSRLVRTTTYLPTHDLDVARAEMFMDLQERTGDVGKYRSR